MYNSNYKNLNKLEQIYKWKSDLLLNGLSVDDKFLEKVNTKGLKFFQIRKGGAGPAGGRYFLFENGSVVNVQIFNDSEKSYLILNDLIKENPIMKDYFYVSILNKRTKESINDIQLIPIRNIYDQKLNLNGTINKQIALIHGLNTLATTIDQKCKYWSENKKCLFCGIEFSLKNNETIEKKSSDQVIKAIEDAIKLNLCKNITLTSGTTNSNDKGILFYIEHVKKIKQKFPHIPIHVQIEPVENFNLIVELKNAGVDTIGIHIEILDDNLRKIYCPGKYSISKSFYYEFWKRSVEIFGIGQVTSFILVGFGENINELCLELEKLIEIGVVPIIVPVRKLIGTNIENKLSLNDLISIYDSTAKFLIQYNINPLNIKAGCGKCGGCSAINEAYEFWKLKLKIKT